MNFITRTLNSSRLPLLLSIFVFLYSLSASLLAQLWFIPTFFTQSGASEGLVILDSLGFDRIAREQVEAMQIFGWSAWGLRPEGQSPAGILSVFYYLFGSSPLTILPFNAALHAFSAYLVFTILRAFFSASPSMVGALVFVLHPSSFEWVAQVHRDGIFILGILLLMLATLSLTKEIVSPHAFKLRRWCFWFLTAIAGSALIWVSRPYWLHVSILSLLATFLMVMPVFLSRRKTLWRDTALYFVTFSSIGLMQYGLMQSHGLQAQFNEHVLRNTASKTMGEADPNQEYGPKNWVWEKTTWMPSIMEANFYRLGHTRQTVHRAGGGSLVDVDRDLTSVNDVLGYVPRALQIGLFSPFPNLWTGEGSTPAMTMARKLMGIVTLLFYLFLVGTLIALWQMRSKLSFWIVVSNCMIGIAFYSIVMPNIGALIRFRYSFFMLLAALGAAALVDMWCGRKYRTDDGRLVNHD
ncbi:MAG: hypothetical protein P8N92_04515 [Burkholderiales bacterium]|nr:hypothetical protein [Burkholderiales bacterium]